jgi:DNA-binding PadR family transcriptional regulator
MSAEPGQIQGHLEGLILAVMVSGPCHGYEVIRRLTASSGGLFDLPEGTVYPALYRLEKAGALASAWQTVEGRRRRVYSITDAGRVRLGERRERWRLFSDAISRILGAATGTAEAGGSA